jgi:hypothetical protein
MAYITPPEQNVTLKRIRHMIYGVLLEMAKADRESTEVRIVPLNGFS